MSSRDSNGSTTGIAQSSTRGLSRPRFSPVEAGFTFMAIVLVVVPIASLLVTRATNRTQEDLSARAEPLARALGQMHVDTLALANEATRYAITGDLTERTRYDIGLTLLDQDVDQLRRLAASSEYEDEAENLVALFSGLRSSADAGVDASLRGESEAAQRRLVVELPERLAEFRVAVGSFEQAVRTEIAELRESVDSLATLQRVVLVIGSLLGAVGLAVLILLLGARRRLLRDTENERARFDRMLEATGFGVLQVDGRGRIQYVNPAAATYLDYPQGELVGMPLPRLFQSSTVASPAAALPVVAAFRANERYFGEDNLTRRDGSVIPVDIGIYPVDAEEGPVGAVIIFQNTTERVQRQQRQEEFFALASHELRTPLTSILGFSRRLDRRRAELDPETASTVETLLAQSERMRNTIEAFLAVPRLEADVFRVEIEPLSFRQVVASEVEELQERSPEAQVEFEAPDTPTVVESDEMRLRQVLVNLLNNAVRHGGTPPHVHVRVYEHGNGFAVAVSDNGAGIAPEDRPYIFDRFYRRADAERRREGLGVGLYVSRQIADRLGATLTFVTEVGSGTTFELLVPARYAPDRRQWPPSSTRDRSLRPSA